MLPLKFNGIPCFLGSGTVCFISFPRYFYIVHCEIISRDIELNIISEILYKGFCYLGKMGGRLGLISQTL